MYTLYLKIYLYVCIYKCVCIIVSMGYSQSWNFHTWAWSWQVNSVCYGTIVLWKVFSNSGTLLVHTLFSLDASEEICRQVDSLSCAQQRKHFSVISGLSPQLRFTNQAWVTNLIFNQYIVLCIRKILLQRSAPAFVDRNPSFISGRLGSDFSPVR